jgi:hypothetical protein
MKSKLGWVNPVQLDHFNYMIPLSVITLRGAHGTVHFKFDAMPATSLKYTLKDTTYQSKKLQMFVFD